MAHEAGAAVVGPRLNLLMAAPFFAGWVRAPLWLVFKHPDRGHERRAARAQPAATRPSPPNRNSCSSPDAGKHPNSGVSKAFQKSCTPPEHGKYTRKRTLMFSSAEEVLRFIAEENVEFIDVRFCDLPGTMQHFTVPTVSFSETSSPTA